MRKLIALIVVGLAVASAIVAYNQYNSKNSEPNTMDNLKLTSTAFEEGQPIPDTYTCKGVNISPPMTITAVPDGAESLALILHDPDAPGGDFLHWLVWNLPADTSLIAEQSLPADAVQGQNDFSEIGYGGPCPPSGTHRYQFDLYALDISLELDSSAKRTDLQQVMEGHILDQTTLTGTFSAE